MAPTLTSPVSPAKPPGSIEASATRAWVAERKIAIIWRYSDCNCFFSRLLCKDYSGKRVILFDKLLYCVVFSIHIVLNHQFRWLVPFCFSNVKHHEIQADSAKTAVALKIVNFCWCTKKSVGYGIQVREFSVPRSQALWRKCNFPSFNRPRWEDSHVSETKKNQTPETDSKLAVS